MKNISPFIFLLALVKFILPFTLHDPAFGLHRDEYLYYQQGRNLDLGYLENPPLIGLLGYISSLAGGSFFWVKFWPALFGAFTLVVTAGITRELGGKLFAQVVAGLGILFSAYLRIHFLFQPNFLEIFFWTLSAWFLLRYINSYNTRYFYLLFFSMAAAWYSKYSLLFFALAFAISIVLTHHRTVLKEKKFWLAAVMGLMLILPNIAWQWMHNWPLVHHMQELKETQLQYISKTNFIKEQLLLLLPVCFVWAGGLVWLLRHQQYRIIAYMYLIVILLVMLGSGKGYYTLGAYPMLLAAGGVWLESITIGRMFWRIAIPVLIVLFSAPLIPLLMPLQSPEKMEAFNRKYEMKKLGILKWEDLEDHPLQQDFADMLGWKEMAGKTETFYSSLPDSIQHESIIYCRNYGQAGALKYYARNKDFKRRVMSDNGTFLLWMPQRIWFKHLIFVGEEMPGNDDEVFRHFQHISMIDSVNNTLAREYGTKIIFFQNASDSAWRIAMKGIAGMKAEFGR